MQSGDSEIRLRAFQFLDQLRERDGDALRREDLETGFEFEGRRVPLVGPQGIFKPAVLDRIPISITTVPIKEGKARPYEDSVGEDGLIRYKYRGTDPNHHENVGLRTAMVERVPIVYFFGLVPGRYAAAYPVYIVADDRGALTFSVAIDDRLVLPSPAEAIREDEGLGRRRYITSLTQRRLHQDSFRERVFAAYRRSCSVCKLSHTQLLDAAHILPDGHPKGEPWVSNGLALCKIHHAAFDSRILGIRPDLHVEIREDIRLEKDGPMLKHGLQELHGKPLMVVPKAPHLAPNPEFLAERFEEFRKSV